MTIFDSHAHIFPFLGDASGYESADRHLMYIQRALARHVQPVRRVRDNTIVEGGMLWDETRPGPAGRRAVNFRVTKYGRAEWTVDGENYYLQYMPPSLQENAAPVEFVISLMDYAEIERAVLQNDHIYGNLNEYFAEAVCRFPKRLVGLAQIDESRAYAADQVRELRRAVRDLGMRGVYFKVEGLFVNDFKEFFDEPCFEPFWEEVKRLGIVVFWDLGATPWASVPNYLRTIAAFRRWRSRYRDVPCVWANGIPTRLLAAGGTLEIPDQVKAAVGDGPVLVEVIFPIVWGKFWAYPYWEAVPMIREMYRTFGAEHLVWGSDIPNVERHCTYQQCLDHLRKHCPFIPQAEMDRILGGNLAALFPLAE
jgi:predicted TIM-barrel fold metal-dependent hydrolase